MPGIDIVQQAEIQTHAQLADTDIRHEGNVVIGLIVYPRHAQTSVHGRGAFIRHVSGPLRKRRTGSEQKKQANCDSAFH